MQIDFNYTWQRNGIIGFENQEGQTVKNYPFNDFEAWCIKNKIDDGTDVEKYIDDNWLSLTEAFYIAMNPTSFISHNLVQQSIKI